MSMTTYSAVLVALNLIGLVVSALVAASALIVALVLTARRTSVLAAWLLFLSCAASALLALLYIVLPPLAVQLMDKAGQSGFQWLFVVLGIASLGLNALLGIALLLFRRQA